MKRSIRYVIATAASSAGAAAALTSGLIVGKFAVKHGVANGIVIAVTNSIVGVVPIPAYIVKKLLVDYW